jgi:hypothetical protein
LQETSHPLLPLQETSRSTNAHLPACLIIQQGARSVTSPRAALTIRGASATAGAAAACARTTIARLLLAAGLTVLLRSCCICCCMVAADIV